MRHSDWYSSLLARTQRQHLRVLAFVVLVTSVIVLIWWGVVSHSTQTQHVVLMPPGPENLVTDRTPVSPNDGSAPLTASPSEPVLLRIPSLGIEAPFEGALFLDEAGAAQVPTFYDTVGWYGYGPTPGQLGPAVVLGHVDSYEGPAIFFSLGTLKPGDRVEIEREDGTVVIFAVTGMERVEQDTFPLERVYGNIPYAGLRLITCSGVYDRRTMRYSHNLIVYAKLIAVEDATVAPAPAETAQPVEIPATNTLQ